MDHHINVAAGKAYKKLGLIKHSLNNLDEVSITMFYTSPVRPHLEYEAPIWNPFLKKKIEKLEKVQHAAYIVNDSTKFLNFGNFLFFFFNISILPDPFFFFLFFFFY
jgi:hypothetical protein